MRRVASEIAGVVSTMYHALPGTGPAKPPGLSNRFINRIKKAQEDEKNRLAAHEKLRVASMKRGKEIKRMREDKNPKKRRSGKKRAPSSKPNAAKSPVKVEVASSIEPRSKLRSYLTTVAAVAGIVTAAYLAFPLMAAGLTAATTTPTVLAGTTSTALVAYTAPAVATTGSALAATAVNTSLVPLGMQAAGSLLIAGTAMTAQRGNVNIHVNNLALFATKIGVPERDLLTAAATLQGRKIDPAVHRTILELSKNPSGQSQIEADTSLAVQLANTPSSTMQSSAARFLQWAASPAIRVLGTPVQILECLADKIFQSQPVVNVNAHGTTPLPQLPAPNTVLAISPPPPSVLADAMATIPVSPDLLDLTILPSLNIIPPDQTLVPSNVNDTTFPIIPDPTPNPQTGGVGLGPVAAAGIGTVMLGTLLFDASQPSSRVQKAEVVGANGWSYTIAINLPDGKKKYSEDEIEMISKALVTGVLDKLSAAGSIEAGVPLAIELPETGGFKATTLKPEGKKPAKSGKPVNAPKVYEYKPDEITVEQQTCLAPLRLVLAIPASQVLHEAQQQQNFELLRMYFDSNCPVRFPLRPVGLRNASTGSGTTHTASNLCALNAAFQSLYAVPEYRAAMRVSTCDPLRKAVENYERIQAAQSDELVDLTALLDTFTSSRSIPSLRNKRQHDSSEYENELIAMLEGQNGNPILGMRVKSFKRWIHLNGPQKDETNATAAEMTTRFITEIPQLPNFNLVMPKSDLRLSSMIDSELFGHIIEQRTGKQQAKTGLRLRGEMMFERPPKVLSFDVKRGMGDIYRSGNTDLYGKLDSRKIQVDETYKLKIKSPDKADTEATYDLTSFRVYDGSGSSGHHYSYQKQVVALADGTTQVKYIMTNDGTVRDDLTREQFLAAAQDGVSFRFRLKK